MKKLVLALLMMTSIPVFAEESLFEEMDDCTYSALKQTQYSMYASATPEDKKDVFDKFIASEVVENPRADHLIKFLGAMAWKFRDRDPVAVGYSAYKSCLKDKGTAT